ncbi:MAG: GNAT family N-acetyltransferase, partial [Clostridia bacterium]|nr:GNAT family N-acetyltransferase [Clostridia bacterium]
MSVKICKGNINDDEFIDFIQYVFGFNGSGESSFYSLLPKLYGNGRIASDNNWFVVDENGKPLAAVGLYDIDYVIGDRFLHAKGIGNVAVHPRHRSKGYMIASMNAALQDAIDSGAAMVVLGGVRHRYGHFGFEKCSLSYRFDINPRSVRYVLGDYKPSLKLVRVNADDNYYLDGILELQQKERFRAVRNRKDLFDILVSWHSVPYVFLDNDKVVGFAIRAGNGIPDFYTDKAEYIDDMVACLARDCGALTYETSLYEKSINDRLSDFASYQALVANECVNVLNWEAVLGSMMDLSSSYGDMSDGSFVFEIDGYRQKETLELSCSDGKTSVCRTDREPQMTLSHHDAMELFFSVFSKK